MNTEYRYQLESKRLTGHQPRKLTCPHCGKRKCLVRYVDTQNGFRYVAESVGKCDHQHSCGYHYKPSDYYKDNKWDDTVRKRPACGQSQVKLQVKPQVKLQVIPQVKPQVGHLRTAQPPNFQPLPMEYVLRSQSPGSIFWQWFSTDVARRLNISKEQLQLVYQDYFIGATRRSNVIFWQIDQLGQVHGGHIMQYRTDGHRDGFQGWTHVPLMKVGLLPPDWLLYQCLFGQHLLSRRPDAHVCLVESEKTALVMAACQPEHLWLATAGSGGLSAEKVKCLQGRRVTLFPDSGCYEKWTERMKLTNGIDYNVSKSLEVYPPNTDLCDLLLGEV